LLEALEVLEHAATIVQARGILWRQRSRTVVARQCLLEPSQTLERIAAIVVGVGDVGLDLERGVDLANGRSIFAPLVIDDA
jgi:hypothetical protein